MRLGALIIAAGLLVSGCGSGDDAARTTDTGAADTTTTAPATTEPATTTTSTTTAPATTEPTTTTTSTTAPTTTAPPTTAPPASAPTWDEIKGAEIPSLCGHPPTTLVEGRHTGIAENMGIFELLQQLPNGGPALVPGVPSPDAGPLTAVVADCNQGGVAWPHLLVLFAAGGEYYASTDLFEADWASVGLYGPGRSGITEMSIDGEGLILLVAAERQGDASCCPTGSGTVSVAARDRAAVVTGVQLP